MALLWGDSSGREVALLRRRVELLEEQVAMLAKFAGMDPNHLPQARPVLDEQAQQLALCGQRIAAIKVHRETRHLDLVTAKDDVEAFLAEHSRASTS